MNTATADVLSFVGPAVMKRCIRMDVPRLLVHRPISTLIVRPPTKEVIWDLFLHVRWLQGGHECEDLLSTYLAIWIWSSTLRQ